MKHLLNGVAIAAALAIAAPAWAQAPMTPSSPSKAAPKAAATPAAGAPAAPMASKQRHKRMTRRMARRGGAAPNMTDQLNREELARIQGGGAPGMPPQGSQPNDTQGVPGAGQPSASYHR